MKVEDLGLGPPIQNFNENPLFSSSNRKRTHFFNFISIYQNDSQKISILTFIASFYSLFQIMYISFWPYLNLSDKKVEEKFDFIRTPPYFEKILTIIFFLFDPTDEAFKLYLNSFIIFVISILFFILSLTCFLLYFYKNIINFQLLFCFNFFVQFICPIVAIPLGFQTGWLISRISFVKQLISSEKYSDEGSIPILISLAVLNGILFLIILFINIINNIFNSNSVVKLKYYFVSYDWIFESCLTLIPAFILFLASFLPLFNEKLRYLVVLLHLIYCICIIIWSFWLPLGNHSSNSIAASISISSIITDIFCFTDFNGKWFIYVGYLGLFIIFYFAMHFFIGLRVKSILKSNKKKEENIEIKDESNGIEKAQSSSKHNFGLHSQRFQMFGDPEVEPTGFENLSVSKALFALRIALITRSSVFIDGKLMELIMTKVDSIQDKIELGLLICYFPDFQPFFFSLLTSLKKVHFLPFLQDYQLHQLRSFDVSCSPSERVKEVEELIRETSANEILIRSLWQVIYSECSTNETTEKNEENVKLKTNMLSLFDQLSTSVYNCHSKWRSMINLYPNNIEITDEYSKFLIKCYGNFINAADWQTISRELQQGKIYKFNPAVTSFLKAYPHYSKNIVPKNLLLLNLDDIDIHTKFNNIEKLTDMPEIRFEYQRSTKLAHPLAIYIFLACSIVSLLYILIFWMYGFYEFQLFEIMLDGMDYFVNSALVSEQISKTMICAIMNYGQDPSIDIFPFADEIYNTLFENSLNDRIGSIYDYSLIELDTDYKMQLSYFVEQGMIYVNYLNTKELDQIEKGNNIDLVLNEFYLKPLEYSIYFTKNHSTSSVSNLQTLAISFFTYYFFISVDDNLSYINDPNYYRSTMAGAQVLDNIDNISNAFLNSISISLEKTDNLNSTVIITIGVTYILFSLLSIWISFFIIKSKFNSIVNSLCYFPQSIKQKAICSILKENENNNNNNNNNDNNNDIDDNYLINIQSKIKKFVLISLICVTLIHIGLGSIIFSFHFIYSKYKSQFKAIAELVHYYSTETSQIVDVLYSVMAANAFHTIVPAVEKKYKDKLLHSSERFLKSHQARWSYSVDGDCGIKGEYLNEINDLKNHEKCPDWHDKSYHEIVSCLSEESGLNAFVDLTDSMIANINNPKLMKTDLFKQYIHFSLSHLYNDVSQFQVWLMFGAFDKEDEYTVLIRVLGASSFVIAFVLFYLNLQIYNKMRRIYKLLFAFISRVNPSDLITNNQLLKTLFDIRNNKKEEIDNCDKSFVAQDSSSPVVFIDRSALIEYVNYTFTRKFGLESNFIVGQSISTLIDDESFLFYIDKMKFFETKKSVIKTIQIKKENGNKTLYDVAIIPIHNSSSSKGKNKDKQKVENESNDSDNEDENSNSFVNRIALVFIDKTAEINLQKKCNAMNSLTTKIENYIFPKIFDLFIEGYLKMCAICLVKFPNVVTGDQSTKNTLAKRQSLYELLYEKLAIFPLLQPLDSKNGIFAVIGYQKNDPAELGIECLNFAFTIVDEFTRLLTVSSSHSSGLIFSGQLFAVVETGGELNVGWLGNEAKKVVITGELMDRALRVLDNANRAGTICVSKDTYEHLMQLDFKFIEKEIYEEICGCSYIFSIEKNVEPFFDPSRKSSDYSSDNEYNPMANNNS